MLAKVVACLFVTIFVSLFAAVWKLRSVKSVRRPLRLICLWVGVLVSLFMAINKGFSFDQLSLYQPACLALALVLIFMINIVLRMDLAT